MAMVMPMTSGFFSPMAFRLTDQLASEKAVGLLDSALSASESSVTHAYKVVFCLKDGFCDVTFNRPTSFVLDNDLHQKILTIFSSGFFPYLTFFPLSAPEMVATGSNDFATAMAFRYRFKVGTFKRLEFGRLSDIKIKNWIIPLMKGYNFDLLASSGMVALSGPSGSGKTSFALYLLQSIYSAGAEVMIVDPKLDNSLYHFAEKRNLSYVAPGSNSNDYFNSILKILSSQVDEIHQRQRLSLEGKEIFKPRVLFIDEAMALTASIADSKQVKQYLSLISQITLQGRSAKVFLWLGAQTFSASGSDVVMSSSSRDQMSLKVVLSQVESDWRYLFKDLNLNSMVLTRDGFSKGLGVAGMMSDGRVVPFLAPKIDDLEG